LTQFIRRFVVGVVVALFLFAGFTSAKAQDGAKRTEHRVRRATVAIRPYYKDEEQDMMLEILQWGKDGLREAFKPQVVRVPSGESNSAYYWTHAVVGARYRIVYWSPNGFKPVRYSFTMPVTGSYDINLSPLPHPTPSETLAAVQAERDKYRSMLIVPSLGYLNPAPQTAGQKRVTMAQFILKAPNANFSQALNSILIDHRATPGLTMRNVWVVASGSSFGDAYCGHPIDIGEADSFQRKEFTPYYNAQPAFGSGSSSTMWVRIQADIDEGSAAGTYDHVFTLSGWNGIIADDFGASVEGQSIKIASPILPVGNGLVASVGYSGSWTGLQRKGADRSALARWYMDSNVSGQIEETTVVLTGPMVPSTITPPVIKLLNATGTSSFGVSAPTTATWNEEKQSWTATFHPLVTVQPLTQVDAIVEFDSTWFGNTAGIDRLFVSTVNSVCTSNGQPYPRSDYKDSGLLGLDYP
jgi:hypothetical protein